MHEAPEGRGGFLFNVNLVFLSQIAIYGFAFGLRVVLARGLGDSGLGTYSLFFVGILVAGGIANLGVGLGNIYFLNKSRFEYRTLLSNSLVVIFWTGVAGWAFVLAWAAIYGRDLFIKGDAYWLWGLALPAVIGYTILTSFLHGRSRFVGLQTIAIGQGGLALALVTGLDIAGELRVGTAVAAWTASFLAADFVCLLLLGVRQIDIATVVRPQMEALGEQVRYGVQGQMANMAALFNYRLDQFLVAAFVSTAGVGHYTVAVGLSESVWWISSAVSLVMLPRLTAMTPESAQEVTPLVCRNTFLISVVAGAGLIAVSPVAIPVLFGDEFYPDSFLPLVLLMPGIVAASAQRVLGSYLFSQGKVIYNTYASIIALVVSIGLDFIAVPLFEVSGAAAMSSVAYTCALIATLYWYRQVSGGSVWAALVPHLDDRRHYMRVLRRVMDRSGGRAVE